MSVKKNKKNFKKEELEKKVKKYSIKKFVIVFLVSIIILVSIIAIILLVSDENKEELYCSVNFNTNGGFEIDAIVLECGGTIGEPNNPEKNGFKFLGWYLNDSQYNFSSKVDDNIVLDAKWEADGSVEVVKVKFDTDGGSKQDDIELEKGTYLVRPVDPIKEGYSFLGWYLDNEEFLFITTPINKEITLKAKWKKEIKNDSSNKNNNKNNISNNSENKNGSSSSNSTTDSKEDTSTNNNKNQFNEYDDIVKIYSGRWYLSGYEDVYIDVSKHTYTDTAAMEIISTNFSLVFGGKSDYRIESPFVKYPCSRKEDSINGCISSSGSTIAYNKWESDLKSENITLKVSSIDIGGNNFVRNKGSKNKYTNTYYPEIVGTWYEYNAPDYYIKITTSHSATSPTSYDSVSVEAHLSSSGFYHSGQAKNDYFNSIGITYEDGVLTYNGTKYYKEKKYIKVSSISVNQNNLNLSIGEKYKLNVTISPTDAYYKKYSFSSSDTSIATVSSNGTITAKTIGTTIITVTSLDNNKTATCIVVVKDIGISSVSLNKNSLSLVKGKSETLSATISPTNATNKNITWSSSNTNVAKVDSSGKVTAVGKGTATITVKTSDGGYTAECVVTVSNPSLTATGSIGISTIASSSGITRGVFAEVNASGGTGTYTYYYIKLYKDGTLIGTTTNTSSNELFISGYSNGRYTMEYEVRDSDGTVKKGTSSSTISGF